VTKTLAALASLILGCCPDAQHQRQWQGAQLS
jgi:hypothetical protein